MISLLKSLPISKKWWGGMFLLCLSLEAVALFYQYQLNQLPCVLCIHVRMLLAAIMLVCILGWLLSSFKWASYLPFVLLTALWLWMSERSYQLLGVERGWIFGECDMSSGLPEWLALEKWFPWLFEIFEPCGYTPFLVFRISMAEVLIVLSFLVTLICLSALVLRISKQ